MPNLVDIAELLDYRSLTASYTDAVGSGAPNAFFDFYNNGPAENYDTDTVEFLLVDGIREPAPLNGRGNAARVLQPEGLGKAELTMVHSFDVIRMNMDFMSMLREPESHTLQRRGASEINRQMEHFARKHELTKQVYQAKLFQGATIYVDPNGKILESSSGAQVSVGTGIPSANLGKIDGTAFGLSGDVIGTAWDDAGAKIITDLEELQECAQYAGSYPLRHAWAHTDCKRWFRQNTELLAFYSAGQERLDRDLLGDTFTIGDITFHFTNRMYKAVDGTLTPFVARDKVIFTPEVSDGGWLARGNGIQLVPGSLDIKSSWQEAMNDWQEVYGDYSYAVINHNPVSVDMFMGFHWLMGFKAPENVFCATVDF